MASSDKFLQGMVDLLDKLIDHQSKNGNLLTEIKSSISEIRNETDTILTNIREKLPATLINEQEESYRKLTQLANKIEDDNKRLEANIEVFQEDYRTIKSLVEKNSEEILNANNILQKIHDLLNEKEEERTAMKNTILDVKGFMDKIRSRKAWFALIVAGITALATLITASVSGVNSLIEMVNGKTSATQQTAPTNQPVTPKTP
jgi:chromosome segregation ATPase